MNVLNILVACEESQRVCAAFRELGHNAFSCDIIEPSGGHPEWHILENVLNILNPCFGEIFFDTMDGKTHVIDGKWDLIVAHPPCTYLSNAGACRLYTEKGVLNCDRYKKGLAAKEFFLKCLTADCEHIAVENPIPSTIFELPPYDQVIEPFQFGHPYSKKTCLWLQNLPLLRPTKVVTAIHIQSWVSAGSKDGHGNQRKNVGKSGSAKERSKTFEGIAKAMAEQWSAAVLAGYTDKKQLSLFEEG